MANIYRVENIKLGSQLDELKGLLGSSTLAHSEAIERERALMAHIHAANLIIDAILKTEGSPLYLASKMKRWRGQAPADSLDRLKLQCQAEGLENFAAWLPSDYEEGEGFQAGVEHARYHANGRAEYLRRLSGR